jgi:hypothetical protein
MNFLHRCDAAFCIAGPPNRPASLARHKIIAESKHNAAAASSAG